MPAKLVGPFAGALPAPDREEGKPCDDASRPKSDERLTAVFAALAACDLAEGAPAECDRSNAAKKEPHRPSKVSSACCDTPVPRRGFFAAGSQAACESEALRMRDGARSKEDGSSPDL